jgi:hypothetical protein
VNSTVNKQGDQSLDSSSNKRTPAAHKEGEEGHYMDLPRPGQSDPAFANIGTLSII